ncbi:hypothetical protein SH449x_000783 [Pirellulaceae bacterium SH449]
MENTELIVVSELDHERIAALRADGYIVARIVPNHFGDDQCSIDGFVLIRRS